MPTPIKKKLEKLAVKLPIELCVFIRNSVFIMIGMQIKVIIFFKRIINKMRHMAGSVKISLAGDNFGR